MGGGAGFLIAGVLAVFFGTFTWKYLRRLGTVVRTLRGGARAPGRCVRVETEPYNRSDAKRHWFAFRTEQGEDVEFEDLAGWLMNPGDEVTVAYDPHDPARTATIAGRGSSWSPVLQCVALVGGCGLATAGFATLFFYQLLGGN
ncbi:DUF3592 domain-containing protein [Streptomyces sp. NPDC058045]|uniref:DUF3592 domain-containing protein n=1 Tax=Streptomyces sp. NPDC058045 TaxID=3346311 RepID=UPI0036EDC4F5